MIARRFCGYCLLEWLTLDILSGISSGFLDPLFLSHTHTLSLSLLMTEILISSPDFQIFLSIISSHVCDF
jgi:hypothetical protein